MIVSASLAVLPAPDRRALRFDAVLATELEVADDGRLTGDLAGANVRGPEKARRLDEWLAAGRPRSCGPTATARAIVSSGPAPIAPSVSVVVRTEARPDAEPREHKAAQDVQECRATSTEGGTVVKVRTAIVIGALLVGLAAVTVAPASAQSSDEKPKATEVGVTASEISIAVVADVDNPFAPGLFKGAVDGVKAGAAYLNSKAGGGGLAGRKVVVDFYDSKLNGERVAQRDHRGLRERLRAGGHVGAVPHPGRRHRQLQGPGRSGDGHPRPVRGHDRCARVVLGDGVPGLRHAARLRHRHANPQTFYANQGPPKWELSKHKGGLHGVTIVGNDTKDAARGGTIARPGSAAGGHRDGPGRPGGRRVGT